MAECFDLYSEYYDLLYQDKDYQKEVNYINELIKEYGSSVKTILELGCGTGKHASILHDTGYSVCGIDMSEGMLAKAKLNEKEGLIFDLGDVRTYRCSKKFDAVISLFHVASYQEHNDDLERFFETASGHLNLGGLFVFDFWYGPAVLSDKPVVREKKLSNDNIEVYRKATPIMYNQKNVVEVNYDLTINKRDTSQKSNITESHRMRYLFLPEIQKLAADYGFALEHSCEWLSDREPSFNSWYACVVLKKVTK